MAQHFGDVVDGVGRLARPQGDVVIPGLWQASRIRRQPLRDFGGEGEGAADAIRMEKKLRGKGRLQPGRDKPSVRPNAVFVAERHAVVVQRGRQEVHRIAGPDVSGVDQSDVVSRGRCQRGVEHLLQGAGRLPLLDGEALADARDRQQGGYLRLPRPLQHHRELPVVALLRGQRLERIEGLGGGPPFDDHHHMELAQVGSRDRAVAPPPSPTPSDRRQPGPLLHRDAVAGASSGRRGPVPQGQCTGPSPGCRARWRR